MCKSLMNPSLLRLARLVLLASMSAAPLWAQGVQTGTLRGIIMDGQNQVLPGATVTVSSPALLQSRTQVTDTTGLYVFRALPPGDYTVTVSMPSFKDFTKTVTVPLGGTVEQGAILALANVTETVQVVGAVPPPLATPDRRPEHQARRGRGAGDVANAAGHLDAFARPQPRHAQRRSARDQRRIRLRQRLHAERRGRQRQPVRVAAEPLHRGRDRGDAGAHLRASAPSTGASPAASSTPSRKSGGNTFSGSYRLNLTNPSWVAETPFEKSSGVTHARRSDTTTHEATFGGPIVKDRLWFFTAGRLSNRRTAQRSAETGIGVTPEGRQQARRS